MAKAGVYRGSIRPFGQTLKGDLVQPEADAVRAAAADLVAGAATFFDIAKRWNTAGLLTPQTGRQGGREWTSGTVRNFYTRPRLVGRQEMRARSTTFGIGRRCWTPRRLPTSKNTDRLQADREARVSKGRADAHLLTGIVRCECGRGMNIAYRGAKGSPRIYRCPTVNHQTVTALPLERAVAEHALDLMAQQDEGKAEAEEATRRIAHLLDDRRSAESVHDQWLSEAVEAALSPALISKRQTAHAARLSEIDFEVIQHRQSLGVSMFAVANTWRSGGLHAELTGWESTPVPQRRDVLKSLFDAVLVARGSQGKRFKAERVSYSRTPLGDRLYDRWAENQFPDHVPATLSWAHSDLWSANYLELVQTDPLRAAGTTRGDLATLGTRQRRISSRPAGTLWIWTRGSMTGGSRSTPLRPRTSHPAPSRVTVPIRVHKVNNGHAIWYHWTMEEFDEGLLNVRETAKLLGVHENTVRNWVRQGLLPDSRIPGSRFHKFRASDVERLKAQRGASAPSLQTERRIVSTELARRGELSHWPELRSRDAQSTFPEMMRRLLSETPGISLVSLRAGDGVAIAGPDGVVESDGTSPFLPTGRLLFEFGVDARPGQKATVEYDKRAAEGHTDCSFVFATPRRWPGAEKWAAERRSQEHFVDVRGIDADFLEGWLLEAPSTHHWISEYLGLRPRDAVSLDTWWSRFEFVHRSSDSSWTICRWTGCGTEKSSDCSPGRASSHDDRMRVAQ